MESGTGGDSRTRDELANERTFLAWLRTAANVMIVGLAVAKFGTGDEVTAASLSAGGILVAVGAAGVVYGGRRYRQTSAGLSRGQGWPADRTRGPVVGAAVLIAAIVVALVILLVSERPG